MWRTLAPIDFRVISNIYVDISRAPWFEPRDAKSLALYLLHTYSRGLDEASLKAIAEPFAREWFRRDRGRFDVLTTENHFVRKYRVVTAAAEPLCAALEPDFPLESTGGEKERTPPLET
jgi:hypothetical protein